MVCKMIITVFTTVFLLSSSLALPLEEESPELKVQEVAVAEAAAAEEPVVTVVQESAPSPEAVAPVALPTPLESAEASPALEAAPVPVVESAAAPGPVAAAVPVAAPAPIAAPAGAAVPARIPTLPGVANAQGKSDLDTASTFWGGYGYRPYWGGGYGGYGGWRRGWGGYGGYGGYGRGFGGYGGWGWGNGWGGWGRRSYWG